MKKLVLLILILTGFILAEQDTIRVTTYNLLKFSGDEGRIGHFETVLEAINPDVVLTQEMVNQDGVDSFRTAILDKEYEGVPFHDGPDTDNSLFYKPENLEFLESNYLSTDLRDIAEYKIRIISTDDTIFLYSAHLKASQGSENEQRRFQEATVLREHLNQHPPNTNFIVVGDFNLYKSQEEAYQKLIGSEEDNDGRLFDPIDSSGYWHTNPDFAGIHTQSTRSEQFGGGASGGLDDRFDFILISQSLQDNVITSSYAAFGNDGNHYDLSINDGPNDSVSTDVANALHFASDHLPVCCDFVFADEGYIEEKDYRSRVRMNVSPNPFVSRTTISYFLPISAEVELSLSDVSGRKVKTLAKRKHEKGIYHHQFRPSDLPSGLYFCILEVNHESLVEKLLLIR